MAALDDISKETLLALVGEQALKLYAAEREADHFRREAQRFHEERDTARGELRDMGLRLERVLRDCGGS